MRALVAGLCVVALVGSAAAQEEEAGEPIPARRALALGNVRGLSGFGSLVDARTSELFGARINLHYSVQVDDQDFGGAFDAERDKTRHAFAVSGGVALFGLVEVGARLPVLYDREERRFSGRPDPAGDDDSGFGDLDLAAKVTLGLGPVSLAPYVLGRLPSGESEVRDLAEIEYGASATFALLDDRLAVHGNLAGLQVEEGLQALRARIGASVVPWAGESFLLRVYAYGNGIEYEGKARTDFDLEFGVQTIFLEIFTAELGASVRLFDADFLDDSVKESLRGQTSSFERHFDGDGTFTLTFGFGVVFG